MAVLLTVVHILSTVAIFIDEVPITASHAHCFLELLAISIIGHIIEDAFFIIYPVLLYALCAHFTLILFAFLRFILACVLGSKIVGL